MVLASLTILGLLVATAEPDPSGLVQQLGSARFAEREEAARLLLEKGSLALDALRKAREAKDPEVRSRAATLLAKIEGDLLVRPTMIRLDFEGAPMADVVRAFADRSRVAIAVQPENDPRWKELRVNLSRPEPVRFWDAIDLLGPAAGVQASPSDMGPGRRGGLVLTFGGGWSLGPKSDSGPFRSYLTNVHYSLDLNLGAPVGLPKPIGVIPPPAPAPNGVVFGPVVSRTNSSEQFEAQIQIQAEPRLILSASGQPKLVEALDDKNQSLIPSNAGGSAGGRFHGYGQVIGGSSLLSVSAQLRRPDQPGKTIRVLKGTVPVTVSTRKEGPTVVVLADAKGKPARVGDQVLSLVDLKFEAANHRHLIEISFRADPQVGGGQQAAGIQSRMPILSSNQIEIVDAGDRIYAQWFPQSSRSGPEESRMTLNVMSQEGLGPPAKLRYYELSRASTEVAFDFRNLEVRMP